MNQDLPNVEPQKWIVDSERNSLYLIEDGEEYRVKQLAVIANGTKDLAVILKKDGSVGIGKIAETEPDHILLTSKYDLLWVEFERPIRGTQWSCIVEINDIIDEMLSKIYEVLKVRPSRIGEDFEMFARGKYPL
jgi:hypothetical protein